MLKTCSRCKEEKTLESFANCKSRKDGLQPVCRKCRSTEYSSKSFEFRRRKRMEYRYGITIEDWDLMYWNQKGRCLICGIHQSELKGALHTDHCHDTKKVRGLLCINCNQALGSLMDSPELLRKAADYLDEHNQNLKHTG